ncbi:ARF-binding protein, variant 2 [Entomophthora muscae]|uniref:ARF-binding protein, variant 2 n=1 Tax=Entomophthora muscae TaxID=34485 RepID=A0ACC2UKH3_9FUNG|nr:ARF-binding protein, variant 2 [Entomophthora muscae]
MTQKARFDLSALDAITSYFGLPTGIPNDDTLTMLIERACDPRLPEPSMALNLEIADYIKSKKQNTPHEVSNYLVQLINFREPKVSLLALYLLDTCIRNCGYAFHLQIARKEFLNELVKKFPEQPPAFPNSVQIKILEFINEWKLGLASQARYKKDFRKINELHNILVFKGYKFPTAKPERINTLISKPTLASAEELEEADREALSAKLQEHIRRGTPSDLIKANDLMKLLSGYDQEKKPDYHSMVDRQLLNVEKSIELLSARLVPGVEINDQLRTLYNECSSSQSKIQRLILEEDEGGHAERLLELNDKLNELRRQFDNACKGIFIDGPIEFQDTNSPSKNLPVAETSTLIDLGDDFLKPFPQQLSRVNNPSCASSNGSLLPSSLLDGFDNLNIETPASSLSPAPSTPRAIHLDSGSSSPVNNGAISPPHSSLDLLFQEASAEPSDSSVNRSVLIQSDVLKVTTSSYTSSQIVYLQFDFYNPSPKRIDQLDLKLAVPKGLKTVITGITGTFLLPRIGHVSLPVEIHFASSSQAVKYRYIVTFVADGEPYSYQGECLYLVPISTDFRSSIAS